MADTKISADATAVPAQTDIVPFVSDPGGTPVNKKATVQGLLTKGAAGTSFPLSPATNDQFYRTDRGITYYYDGTRWLSALFSEMIPPTRAVLPLSSTTTFDWNPPYAGVYDLWMIQSTLSFFCTGGTALSASHKWVLTFVSSPGGTTLATVSVDSGANDVWRIIAATSIGALLGTSNVQISVNATKTGTPGDIYLLPRIAYQLVG